MDYVVCFLSTAPCSFWISGLNLSHLASEMSSPDTLPETLSSMPLWEEPKDLDQLTTTYVVENKFAGRTQEPPSI